MVKSMPATFPHLRAKAGSRGEWPQAPNGVILGFRVGAVRMLLATPDDDAQQLAAAAAAGIGLSDQSLLARMASGDFDAFGVLVDRYQAMVLGVASRLLRGTSGADDVAQETLLRLWRSAGQLDVGVHGAGSWLRRVAANLCVDRLRAQGRLAPMDESVPEPSVPALQLAGLESEESAARIETALCSLPDRQRAALALFHFDDLSLLDIAARLDLSVAAVESLLARARRTLKKQLEADWRELLEDSS